MVKPNHQKSSREQFSISKLAIRYSWLTISFWIAIAVAGILAFSSLKYALFPDITFPVVVVNATAPLTTALDTEEKLTKPIEERLNSLEGLDDIRSSSYPGQSVVSLSFDVGTNLETSTQQVETALTKTKLTQGASFDFNFKIIPLNLNESAAISYAIESPSQTLSELSKLTQDQIVPALNKLPGVQKVTLLGAPVSSQAPTAANNTAALTQQGATLVQINGQDAVAIQVIKRGEANTLEVVSRVEEEVAKLRTSLEDVKITLAATQAEYIRDATRATIDALLQAIVLAVLVIFPFLRNWQATLISALAIPISLLATFIVMALFGFNLETITLLALALVIGIMVDDAIVDVENIMRHIENGENPRQAAITGTNEVGLTVTTATFNAVAVFLPIGLMAGVIGQFFKPFGITVSAAMLASLLVARTLSPVLSVYWLKPTSSRSTPSSGKLWQGFAQIYHNLLAWCLGHRWLVMGLAALILVASILLIPMIPKGFIPKLDRGEFNIVYTAPLPKLPTQQEDPRDSKNLSASDLSDPWQNLRGVIEGTGIPNPLQDSLKVAKALEEEVRKSPAVEKVFTIVGSREGEPNKGTIYVKLKDERNIKTSELQEQLRSSLPVLPGVTTSVEDIQFVDTGGQKPLQVALAGNDLKTLSTTANTIKERVEKLPGIVDVSVTGATTENEPIFQIERKNQQRVAYIGANLGPELTLGDATDKVVATAKEILPPGVTLDLGGDSARSGEVFGSFASTLLLSALCILIVLLLLFRNWLDPIIVVTSLPFALVGALLSLLITRSDFGMISLIGFVFLLGLSNKNDIIMVYCINQLRRSGLECKQAVLEAGSVRLRPILMTTASTILGMMPIALGLGAGSELRSPMAVAIIGGLISSTILSLIFIPVVYTILDNWFPRWRAKSIVGNREQGTGNRE